MITFNIPAFTGNELEYIKKTIANGHISGDGEFTRKCSSWFEQRFNCEKVLLTTSCTSALEMMAILLDIKEGDEIIMPSYTFVSTANAFALRGAKIVFVDIRRDTMNIDEKLIEEAITSKTRAIVVVHYAGVSCDMDVICKIAREKNILVFEDAAQGVMSKYKDRYLGTIADLGCYSFHETKNYTCGEGGALVINNSKFIERAEIIREKGTDRSKFFRGQVDKYSWVDIGSSYLLSDINAAYLYAQLENADKINNARLEKWELYYNELETLAQEKKIELPIIPKECIHNGHLFYIKVKDIHERTALLKYLKDNGIYSVFHYVPLHSSAAGKKYGYFSGKDIYTTTESEKLLRLPLHNSLPVKEINYITGKIASFFCESCIEKF